MWKEQLKIYIEGFTEEGLLKIIQRHYANCERYNVIRNIHNLKGNGGFRSDKLVDRIESSINDGARRIILLLDMKNNSFKDLLQNDDSLTENKQTIRNVILGAINSSQHEHIRIFFLQFRKSKRGYLLI